MIEIDGSQGEGGGQILRTALALSLITGKEFTLKNIRAKRPKTGLMRQHLTCVQAALAITGGAGVARDFNGAELQIGSTALRFIPAAIRAGDYEFSIGTAGSCTLVLQTVLWPLRMANQPSTVRLRGGTHNPFAPSATFLQHTEAMFGGYSLELIRHGFYPAGGGEMHVRIASAAMKIGAPRFTERGKLVKAWAECLHAGVPRGVAERELQTLGRALGWDESQLLNRGLRSHEGPGNALQAILQYENCTEVCTALGKKGVTAEKVAEQLADAVRAYQAHDAPVGEYLADQLLIPMALAHWQGNGEGTFYATKITEHTRTNARIIAQFLPVHFDFQPQNRGVIVKVGEIA